MNPEVGFDTDRPHPLKVVIAKSVDALRSDRRLTVAAVMLAGLVVVAIFGPALVPYGYEEIFVADPLSGPSWQHPLGADSFGRDELTRIVYGARISLGAAIAVASGAILVGFPLGLTIGFTRGKFDQFVSRILDTMFAFPSILLALVVATVLGPGLSTVIYALILVYIPIVTRVIRSATIAESQRDYVLAARVVGVKAWRIVVFHVVPNVTSPLLVMASLLMSITVLAEAALSYLGLGAQPPAPSWGNMLTQDSPYVFVAPHLSLFPGFAIAYFVLALNLLGDGLRDQLDPRLRELV